MADWSHEDELALVFAEVARRASVDADFRELALQDPKGALKAVGAVGLPDSTEVKFLDNTGPMKYVPLPDLIPGLEELSEAELLAIAGGDYSVSVVGGGGPKGPSFGGGVSWHR